MESTRFVNHRLLRCGYTTGSCAAGAAKAATSALLSGVAPETVSVATPRGTVLELDVLEPEQGDGWARCAIRKDAGDDPDATDGVLVYATVRRCGHGVEIDGGEGVGRVTRPGLDQPVGAAAINSTPRAMIAQCVTEAASKAGYAGGISVAISIPDGPAIAPKTFNPHMGIEGGISVLGTSGIVDPMSEKALVDTIRAEVAMLSASGEKDLLITLGNYGEAFAKDHLGLSLDKHVTCSNLIGDTLSAAIEHGFQRALVIGHVGKLVKVAIGMTNTYSHNGDGRMETLVSCALAAGAPIEVLRAVSSCVSTDAALDVLGEAGFLEACMEEMGARIGFHLERYVQGAIEVGFVTFTNRGGHEGVLAQSGNAEELLELWKERP